MQIASKRTHVRTLDGEYPRQLRLSCFVAMAFDRSDTDLVYDNFIKPALRQFGITPMRVDQIEHNDDIDARIISGIEDCDFAIADLTYARPSVYYEAGFAERKVPVIYTCRSDHLKPRADETSNDLRVHFDLQMRNIVKWLSSDDPTFGRRLHRRIALVTGPMVADKARVQAESVAEHEFFSLSVSEQLRRSRTTCADILTRIGFTGQWLDFYSDWRKLRIECWVGCRQSAGTLQVACVESVTTVTKKHCEYLNASCQKATFNFRESMWGCDDAARQEAVVYEIRKKLIGGCLRGDWRYIVLSLSNTHHSRVASYLQGLEFDESQSCFRGERQLHRQNATMAFSLILVDGIRSEPALKKRISKLLTEFALP